jgi:hypothetical protein
VTWGVLSLQQESANAPKPLPAGSLSILVLSDSRRYIAAFPMVPMPMIGLTLSGPTFRNRRGRSQVEHSWIGCALRR